MLRAPHRGIWLAALACLVLPGVIAAGPPKLVRFVESKPVTVNGLEFVALVTADWVIPEPVPRPPLQLRNGAAPLQPPLISSQSGDIHLRITNKTKKDLALLMGGTASLRIRRADGIEVRSNVMPGSKEESPPILLSAGMTYCLAIPSKIQWDKNRDAAFMVRGSIGGGTMFNNLSAGVFTLSYQFANTTVPAEGPNEIEGIPIWTGTVVTPDIQFRITLPPAVVGRR